MPSAPIVYGKYQLLQRLARGGMGEVWKARSHGVEGFEKILVIKRILPALSENQSFVELFIEEAKTAVMLTHANIAQVFDLGLADGTYFMAMEYVKGPDLGEVLGWCKERGESVPPELAIYIVSELAKGLDYAHRRRNNELVPLGIVHRDVSPENVLLSLEGEVKLTDFGMARARESVRGLSELPPSKYAYLAPEQVREDDVDARADVYALGVILFEALTGKRVLEREPARDTFERARRGDRLDVSELDQGRSAALRGLVERATAPLREARHSNAGELYEELIELLYDSGRRVSALELSRWLEDASEAARRRGGDSLEGSEDALGPFSGLTEIFADPRDRPSAPSLVPISLDQDSSSDAISVAAHEGGPAAFSPRSEWRDVSVLLVGAEQPIELSGFAPRFGGELLRNAEGREQMLVFGLGEADGRDAHAAARCALRLVHAHARQGVRVVVHCGRLLLDGDGHAAHEGSQEALRSESARWLKRAKKGEVLASPTAASLLRERFDLSAEHGSGARAIARERRPNEGVGKFIGRREELRVIGEVFALANRGELRVLGVQGEAGMGKSRLIIEIERRLRHAGHDVGMYVASCSPQGRSIPFFAAQELMRAVLGLEDLEPPERVHEQIDRLRLLGLSGDQRDAVTRLIGLSTASTAPGGNTVKLEQALVRVAYKLAQDRLTVFVFDGAEFMDIASRELALKLIASPVPSRVIVLFAYRPLEGGPWAKLPNFDVVHLGPLADEEVARLVRHRLSATEVHGDLVREVLLKTGGNPLFVEELLVAMRDYGTVSVEHGVARLVSGSAQIELPRTLRGLVASRVGKLSGAHRLIMQLAVTFGPRFSPELLARAAELDEGTVHQALAQLAERDIVRMVGPNEHAFVHDLVREVLYGAIPLDERPALHAAVARAIETLLPAELETAVERLAYHYREAGRWDAAVHYLSRAGERYEAEHALDAAIDAYSQVIELVSHAETPDRARVLALHARIGELAFHTRGSELVADRMGAAIELAESWGAEEYLARFAMLRGRLLNKASRFREGRLWLERAQAMARRRGDRELERDVALAAAEAHARNGEYTAVVQYVGDALEVSRSTGDVASEARALLLIAPAYAAVGQLDLARESLAKLTALVGEQPPRLVAVELLRARALVYEAAGELPAACEAARGALDLAKEYGLAHEVAVYAHHLGGLHLRVDEEKRAFAALRLSYDVSTEHGFARLQWRNVCLLGFLDALRFDSEQGYARMQQAVQYAQERGYVLDLIDEKYLLAMVEQKRDRSDRAASLLREVIELADPHGHVRKCEDAEAALRAIGDGVAIALPR